MTRGSSVVSSVSGASTVPPSTVNYHAPSTINTTQRTSVIETSTLRSGSPATSQVSGSVRGGQYDAVSVSTGANTNFTSVSAYNNLSQQYQGATSTPISRTTYIEQHTPSVSKVSVGQEYQQYSAQPQHSAYSAGHFQQSQPHFDAAKAIFNQVDSNHDGFISRTEFQNWAQGGNQSSSQYEYQQTQSYNQPQYHTEAQEQLNYLLGPDAFKDVALDIDYGAIEAYNMGLRMSENLSVEQLMKGNNIGIPKFDAAKAIFNQVDVNRDGSISRDEFRQWAQGGHQNYAQQSYATSGNQNYAQQSYSASGNQNHAQQSYATSGNQNYAQQSYSASGNQNGFPDLFSGATPEIANILEQSGLGQGIAYRA